MNSVLLVNIIPQFRQQSLLSKHGALKPLLTCPGVLLLCAHVLSMRGKLISSKAIETDEDVYMMPGRCVSACAACCLFRVPPC